MIDVASQSSSKNWTLGQWASYFSSSQKRKVLNVISLEVTGTPMERLVEAPSFVRSLDWVTQFWPESKRGPTARENSWPKVQRYCLMGVANAYTDFHVDFAASSVYYHVSIESRERVRLVFLTLTLTPRLRCDMMIYRNRSYGARKRSSSPLRPQAT